MPNLVGIGNSQVPTNAMLGGLAYQNSNNVSIQKGELGDIAEIRAKLNINPISYNHYSIFVYDTSMDSDGGAWRHRTQHTSWYNEAPSFYRGHRREFPSIAVIVSDTDQVSIYDGDDPNLPLWMTFVSSPGGMTSQRILQYTNSAYRVAMLNGILVIGQGSAIDNYGNPIINFISEEVVRADPQTSEGGRWSGNIADRNGHNGSYTNVGYTDPGSGFVIRDSRIRGVAMRVYNDAVIDHSTGLPIPTIALNTSGGVSIITANTVDRPVYDITASAGSSYNISVFCDLTETGCVIFEQDGSNGRSIFHVPIPTADRTSTTSDGNIQDKVIVKAYNNSFSASYPRFNEPWTTTQGIMKGVAMRGDNQALLSFAGKLTLLQPDFHDPYQGRTAYITKDFNTGWMYGGNRRVLMCDTDDTNMVASNLITNGDFTSNTNNWSIGGGNWATLSVVNGRLRITNANNQNGFAYQQITVVAGQTYILMADCYKGTNGRLSLQVTSVGGSMSVSRNPITTDGKYMLQFTPDTNTAQINVGQGLTGNGNYTEVDNVSVRLASHDRSTQAQGMEVIGTLNRTKIFPGSDLVYYDNFDNGYLFQPYSPNNGFADLQFGTGEYYMSIWAYGGSNSQTMMVLERDDVDAHGAILLFLQSGKYAFYSRSNGQSTWSSVVGNAAFGNWWSHVMVVRRGSNIEGWVNGNYQGNVALSGGGNTNGGSQVRDLVIGRRNGHGQIFSGRLALAKIGSGAPLAEDIKKMYDDERKLFAPNAKCTLYGTSDEVKSMAYDKSTDTLHAITSSGRSDFVGLNRINNTTTGSTIAVSAAGGLVAED